MSRVLTHNAWGYARGCRCDSCREGIAQYRREERSRRPKHPCRVCSRIHPGRCSLEGSVQVNVKLPRWLMDRLEAVAPWGERSGYIRDLLERELS